MICASSQIEDEAIVAIFAPYSPLKLSIKVLENSRSSRYMPAVQVCYGHQYHDPRASPDNAASKQSNTKDFNWEVNLR